MSRQIGGAAALGAAMVIGAMLSAPKAEAAYIVTLAQVGSNVVATGSGTINLAGLTFVQSGSNSNGSAITPTFADIITGSTSSFSLYTTSVTGPASFGSGMLTFASSGSGNVVGIFEDNQDFIVPAGYVSGSPLADSATYLGQTFSSLGATPGIYVYTFGSGANADSFTVDIGVVPVPEPASLALLGVAAAMTLIAARGRRRA